MSNYSHGNLQQEERNTSWAKIFDYTFDNSTVLDVGCSDGLLGRELKDKKGCKVYGIEIDEGDFKNAKKVLDGVFNFNIERESIPSTLSAIKFDEIILADVIEHFIEPAKALQKLRSLLTENGRIIFSIPNMSHISVRLQLLGGHFTYNETGLLDKTHLHFYDFDEVKRVFKNAGLQIEHTDSNSLPYPPAFLKKKLTSLGLKDAGFIDNIQNDKEAQMFQFVGYAVSSGVSKNVKNIALSTTTPERELVKYIENLKEDESVLRQTNIKLVDQLTALEKQRQILEKQLNFIKGSLIWRVGKRVRQLPKTIAKGKR